MRIVVTGGAGFIGSNVADAFVERGHEVLIVDDLSTGVEANVNAKARLVKADIRSPEAFEAVRAFRPDALCLHAAQIDVRRSVTEPRLDADMNVGGTLAMLEAGRAGGALSRVVYAASGGSMYGDSSVVPTPETEGPAPVSPYGVSKAAGELYVHAYAAMYGVHGVAVRYANVYGPRQNPHGEAGVVSIFCERLLAGKPCTIYGDGGQTRDFVHVHDVVAANVAALSTGFRGGLNVGTGVETDVNTVYDVLAKALGVATPALRGPARVGEQRRSVLAVAKAKAVLGWTPRYGIAEGLRQTIGWYREQPR